ncbi:MULTISPECIES: hypothetical protein [Paraburkholderia]|uniref:hypothetical protein n=1 Tax=Paraburkholderia TaxID=1822464 RepID=UPI002255FCEE|nr:MULTISPECIES: hypothetical protein [Paraburkholderia]MCX4164561.1 hypothetical protein [Paraburkholderia megapolitana]MDN7160054.1 hypothetical protein [Paraburkholderia sp. CHISQ3]MDQ6497101.1 hypothetical protein [Paraburkholderia megapolitana]
MNIRISSSVLNNPRWHSVLDVLFELTMQNDSPHSFDVGNYPRLVASSWLRGGGNERLTTLEVLRAAMKHASRNAVAAPVVLEVDDLAPVSGRTEGDNTIVAHPLGALAILMQPLHVIVEDETSDGGFFLWMARLLGIDAIIRAYRSGRLLFRHAGGKGQFKKCAMALSYGIWPRPNNPILALRLRAIAILDSDARFPGDEPNAAIRDGVSDHVAHVHVLEGRYIENYVPDPFVRRRLSDVGRHMAIEPFLRMTTNQRAFFPIKRGFKKADSAVQTRAAFLADDTRDTREKSLFESINPADWDVLADGFGDVLSTVYHDSSYRCEPGREHLLSPSQRSELRQILTTIARYL